MIDPQKRQKILDRADAALKAGTITQEEYEYFLKHTIGEERKAPNMHAITENLVAIFLIGMLVLGIWALFGGGLTGFVTLDVPQEGGLVFTSNATRELNITNTTQFAITGQLTGGSARIYLHDETQRLLVYAADAKPVYRVLTDKESYALGETINVTVLPANVSYTLWITDAAGEKTPIDSLVATTPGNYTLDALINDAGTIIKASTTYEIRNDSLIELDVVRQEQEAVLFNHACEQTCSFVQNGPAVLEVELSEGARLTLSNITAVQTVNAPPMLKANIPDVHLRTGESTSIDLAAYFADADAQTLIYDFMTADVPMRLEGSVLIINGTAAANTSSIAYASDMRDLAQSNAFAIIVEGEVPVLNSTITTSEITPNGTLNLSNNITAPENVTLNTTANLSGDLLSNSTINLTNITAVANETLANVSDTTIDCTDPDPNKRPLECIQGDINYFIEQELVLENSNREVVGRFTPIGNLLIKGDIIERSTQAAGPQEYSIGYVDALGEYHATVWIDQAGNLHLQGQLTEANTNIVLQEGWFGMTNRRGILMAMANRQTGDLVIRGSVIPYRRTLEVSP